MEFLLAFVDPRVLTDMVGRSLTGRLPRLRLVSLAPRAEVEPVRSRLPAHLRDRVRLDPSPELLASGRVQALLCDDVVAARAAFPDVAAEDIVTWDDVPTAYDRWLTDVFLPAARAPATPPTGLFPVDWRWDPVRLEVIGSCGAVHLEQAVPAVAAELDADIVARHTIQNHPAEPATGTGETDDLTARVVVPPFRYMHPGTLDDFAALDDHERVFAETVAHMRAYAGSVADARPSVDLYVCGFLEPAADPAGLFTATRDHSNLAYFVRGLNDELAAWCAQTPRAFFVDGDAVAAAIGRDRVDETALTYASHRGPLDVEYDDNTDALAGIRTVPVALSFDIQSAAFARAVIRQVLHRTVIRSQRARVKAVIVDLDNTLWRGLAADGEIGSFNGRPQGVIEALAILRRRGVLVAIASKNDASYIREHWHDILYRWPEVPLTTRLELEDFDAVRIDFRPKSQTVAELLDELGVLPEHAVFVDDNPLEREEVQAALPALRVLGAELNHVRRELLHSPFTQSDVVTDEDRLRARTVRRRRQLADATVDGDRAGFLAALGLRCEPAEVTDPTLPEAVRAVQLINKTNQWSLNGERTTEDELSERLAAGARLTVARVHDAHTAYGIVAVAIVDPARARVTQLVVSCRVIGMGIDDAILGHLLAVHGGPLTLAFAATDRNRAAADAIRRWTGRCADGETQVGSVSVPAHVRLQPAARSLSGVR